MKSQSSTRAEVAALARKQVKLTSGLIFTIRRLGISQMAKIVKGVPDLSAILREAKESASIDQAGVMEGIEETICLAVVEPRFEKSPENAEDAIHPSDLGFEGEMELFQAIMEHSGWSKEAAERVSPLSATGG